MVAQLFQGERRTHGCGGVLAIHKLRKLDRNATAQQLDQLLALFSAIGNHMRLMHSALGTLPFQSYRIRGLLPGLAFLNHEPDKLADGLADVNPIGSRRSIFLRGHV